jgi:hypothetical protein
MIIVGEPLTLNHAAWRIRRFDGVPDRTWESLAAMQSHICWIYGVSTDACRRGREENYEVAVVVIMGGDGRERT